MKMSIKYRRKTFSESQWRKDIRCAWMCLITNFKYITVNVSLRSVPLYECFISIFIIQITQVTETSGGSWLHGLSSDSPDHNDYRTHWQDLNSKTFSIDFNLQNTIQQQRQHTDVDRFNKIQGPIAACHFKWGNVRISLRNKNRKQHFSKLF